MSQVKKLDKLINKVLEEKLNIDEQDGEEREFITPDGTARTVTPGQKKMIAKMKPGATVKYRKPGQTTTSMTLEEKEMDMEEPSPSASDIAGKMSEILDKLNNMSEMKDDLKYKKHATKAAKYMEAAKAALEGLTDYETMLEEKEKQNQEKGAGKTLKSIEKALSKIIKDKNTVAKIMHKMPVSKVIELQAAAQKGIDEEKVAKAMLNVALREAYSLPNKNYTYIGILSEAVNTITAEDEDMYLSDKEKRLSDSRKAQLINFRKDEEEYLSDEEKKLSVNEKVKLIRSRKAEKKDSAEKPEDTADEKEGGEEDLLDNEFNQQAANMLGTSSDALKKSKFYKPGLAEKPYSTWTREDKRKFYDYLSKWAQNETDDAVKKIKASSLSNVIDKDSDKKDPKTISTVKVVPSKDLNLLAAVLKKTRDGKAIDPKEAAKIKEIVENIKSYVFSKFFSGSSDPSTSYQSFEKWLDEVRRVFMSPGKEEDKYVPKDIAAKEITPEFSKYFTLYTLSARDPKDLPPPPQSVDVKKYKDILSNFDEKIRYSTEWKQKSQEKKKEFIANYIKKIKSGILGVKDESSFDLVAKFLKRVADPIYKESQKAYNAIFGSVSTLLNLLKTATKEQDTDKVDNIKRILSSSLEDIQNKTGYNTSGYLRQYKDLISKKQPGEKDSEMRKKDLSFSMKTDRDPKIIAAKNKAKEKLAKEKETKISEQFFIVLDELLLESLSYGLNNTSKKN